MQKSGQVRVGRCVYSRDGTRTDPSFPGFTTILVLTKSSAYGALGPYVLKDDKGRILENLWQGSKVYAEVPKTEQKASRYDSRIIWSHPKETHAIWDPKLNTYHIGRKYLGWRKKLMNCPDPVRYPVGFDHRHQCLFSMAERPDGTIDPTPLHYIEARKKIYVPIYEKAARKTKMFEQLKARLEGGESLLICEVDLCHEEDLDYYMKTYGVGADFITNGTMLATRENLQIMLNDAKHSFGHGFVLSAMLLDIQLE